MLVQMQNRLQKNIDFLNNNIAHPPINGEYKDHKGTAMFLSNTLKDRSGNLKVCFLTNNKELNKAYELYTYQYGDKELLSAFEYADKNRGQNQNDGGFKKIL